MDVLAAEKGSFVIQNVALSVMKPPQHANYVGTKLLFVHLCVQQLVPCSVPEPT